MKNIEQKIIRFYADKPEHVKAFDVLKRVVADKDSSIQEFVIAAINHYGDVKSNEDAQAEIKENIEESLMGKDTDGYKGSAEETLIERVTDVVGTVIEEKIPLILTSYLQVAVAGQIEKALQGVNGFDVERGNAEGVPAAKSATTTTNGTVIKDNAEMETAVEKDVEANDMLHLDSFFS